ncbi:MAG TPA: ArsA-related P-loop ATPase [Candidatus Binataceae bacterium]|nr:ArsA-related P-loop ATPase [Candidatus Binataceae bacterium]
MRADLPDRRVTFILGKGGVGKTTLAAALALARANAGARTLLIETDARAPMTAALGVDRSYSPVEAAPNLFTMLLDGGHALEEYLAMVVPGRVLLRAVFASRLYQFFVQAAPGLRELVMLGKIYYESGRKERRRTFWDSIIVDAPSSGQALALLKMPTAARATFRQSVVGNEAANIGKWLRDRETCAIAEVTTADSLAMSEAFEMHAALSAIQLAPSLVLFNRMAAADFDSADVAAMLGGHSKTGDSSARAHLAEIARAEIARAAHSRAAFARVERETATPVLEIPEFPDLHGRALIDALASFITTRLNIDSVRHPPFGDDRTKA